MASEYGVDKNLNKNGELDDNNDNIKTTHIAPISSDLSDGTLTNIPGII